MIWLPKWKRKQLRAKKWRAENEARMATGWHDWFAWHPVTTCTKEPPFYYESERRVWLTRIERRWFRQHEYDNFRWIYHIKRKNNE